MQQRLVACLQVAQKLGFEQADRSCISRKLSLIEPEGGTNMRDSILAGTNLMLQFRMATEKVGLGQFWNFVHLVITDGRDEHSRTTLEDLGGALYQLSSTLPEGFLKTIYIGIDIQDDRKALGELAALRILGGEQADLFSIYDTQIADIFEKIKISLGIHRRTQGVFLHSNQGTVGVVRQQNQAVLQMERQRYMVLFNIDRSGSMEGQKWKNLCQAVNSFLRQLGSDDLVCALVFNNEVEILSFLEIRRVSQKLSRVLPQKNQPIPQSYSPPPAQSNRVSKQCSCCSCWSDLPSCCKCIIISASMVFIGTIIIIVVATNQ